MTGDPRPENTGTHHSDRSDSTNLAACLAPVQDTLAELTREYFKLATADHVPAMWSTWCDLSTALMSVRNAQGHDARSHGHRPPINADATP